MEHPIEDVQQALITLAECEFPLSRKSRWIIEDAYSSGLIDTLNESKLLGKTIVDLANLDINFAYTPLSFPQEDVIGKLYNDGLLAEVIHDLAKIDNDASKKLLKVILENKYATASRKVGEDAVGFSTYHGEVFVGVELSAYFLNPRSNGQKGKLIAVTVGTGFYTGDDPIQAAVDGVNADDFLKKPNRVASHFHASVQPIRKIAASLEK